MRARVLTALALAPAVLLAGACVHFAPWLALLSLGGILASAEVAKLRNIPPWLAALPLLVLAAPAPPVWLPLLLLGIGTLAPWRALAGFWLAGPVLALKMLHPQGQTWDLNWLSNVFMVLLPIWAGDIAAMMAGRSFGRHKLAPSISPGKTWEGAVANVLAATACGAVIAGPVGATCGAVGSVAGQAGDLYESAWKRKAGLKDSGALLPGHGGILDRIDALLFAAPIVLLILELWPAK